MSKIKNYCLVSRPEWLHSSDTLRTVRWSEVRQRLSGMKYIPAVVKVLKIDE